MRRVISMGFFAVFAIASINAIAATEATLAPSGGLGALTVTLSPDERTIHAGSQTIAAPEGFSPSPNDASVEAISIGQHRSVVHVRVSGMADGTAWEAIIAPTNGSAPNILFSGVTGYAHGEDGERTGDVLTFLGDGDDKTVVLGELHEDLRICGEDATVLQPRAIDAKIMQFRGASMQRLSRSERGDATKIFAVARRAPADTPLAPLLVAAGASSEIGSARALVDGDPKTTWGEARPGAGGGEFVVLRAAAEIPITHLEITIAPPVDPPTNLTKSTTTPTTSKTAAPKSFYLVTGKKIYAVTLPEDASTHPGESYDVVFTEPVSSACLTVVLDEAYSRDPHPDVAIAEVAAFSAFDAPGAKLDDVAKMLNGGGARAEGAAALLKRAGDAGLAATAAVWDTLDISGRALAADVAASGPCASATPLLVKALVDRDREVARKGEETLDRCGRAALPALADIVGHGDERTRSIERAAFMRAAHITDAHILPPILNKADRPLVARIDLLRASSARLPEIATDADAAIDDILKSDSSLRSRYLLLGPIASLARSGDTKSAALFISLLSHDADGPVRAHAAELAAHIAAAQGALLAALSDADPRVREAALRTIADQRLSPATVAVERLLERDPWVFVRASAATTIGAFPAAIDVDRALAASLKDPAARVRVSAIESLGAHRAASFAPDLRARLDDDAEQIDVRVSATRSLGAMCDAASLGRLSDLAAKVASPIASDVEVALGLAAIDAIGAMHPADIARRLSSVTAPHVSASVRRHALDALAEPGSCR
jgi:HEAT repeat protein